MMQEHPSPTIEFNGVKVPIEFGFKEAFGDFKKMGLNLLALFEDRSTLMTIMANDNVMVQVWYYFVKPHCESFDDALEHLTPAKMNVFREVFWQQVVNFSPEPMRKAAAEMWKEAKKELNSPKKLFDDSSLASSESLD